MMLLVLVVLDPVVLLGVVLEVSARASTAAASFLRGPVRPLQAFCSFHWHWTASIPSLSTQHPLQFYLLCLTDVL